MQEKIVNDGVVLIQWFVLILLLSAIVYTIYFSLVTRKHSCNLNEVLADLPKRWRFYWFISVISYGLLVLSFLVAGLVLCTAYSFVPAAEPPILPQDLEPFSDFKVIYGEGLRLFYDIYSASWYDSASGYWRNEPRIMIARKLADEQSVRCDIWITKIKSSIYGYWQFVEQPWIEINGCKEHIAIDNVSSELKNLDMRIDKIRNRTKANNVCSEKAVWGDKIFWTIRHPFQSPPMSDVEISIEFDIALSELSSDEIHAATFFTKIIYPMYIGEDNFVNETLVVKRYFYFVILSSENLELVRKWQLNQEAIAWFHARPKIWKAFCGIGVLTTLFGIIARMLQRYFIQKGYG